MSNQTPNPYPTLTPRPRPDTGDREPKVQEFAFTLEGEVAEKISYEDLRQIVALGAAMLASKTPVRILLRRMQAIRTYEQEG